MTIEMFLPWLGLIVGGYLLGSIMFCRLICLTFFKTDICKVSKDGNPGAANAFWYCGKMAGLIGLILDLLKGFLPVFIAIKYLDFNSILFALVMLSPVFGHAFSIFHGFSGGKCIATIYGELSALFLTGICPLPLAVLGVFNLLFELIVKSVPGNKRAFIMFSILIFASILIGIYSGRAAAAIGTILVSLVAILKHSSLYAHDQQEAKSHKKASLIK